MSSFDRKYQRLYLRYFNLRYSFLQCIVILHDGVTQRTVINILKNNTNQNLSFYWYIVVPVCQRIGNQLINDFQSVFYHHKPDIKDPSENFEVMLSAGRKALIIKSCGNITVLNLKYHSLCIIHDMFIYLFECLLCFSSEQ